MWFNVQEQEERDFFPRSELQNAFSQSQLERKPDDTQKIESLVKNGRFVVVMTHPVYCPRTDAFMGVDKLLMKHFGTRDEANQYCHENQYDDGETSWDVLPLEKVPLEEIKRNYEPLITSEIPF